MRRSDRKLGAAPIFSVPGRVREGGCVSWGSELVDGTGKCNFRPYLNLKQLGIKCRRNRKGVENSEGDFSCLDGI